MRTTFFIFAPALLVGGIAAMFIAAPIGFFVSVIVAVSLAYIVDYKNVLDAAKEEE